MTLLILTTRCRDDLDFMLIKGVTLLSDDLDLWLDKSDFDKVLFLISDLGVCCFSLSREYVCVCVCITS